VRDYRIWGTITHTARDEFLVMVSAVPALYRGELLGDTEVVTRICRTEAEAERVRGHLAVELGKHVTSRGDRVVDVDIG
jgi:hypothetical protein